MQQVGNIANFRDCAFRELDTLLARVKFFGRVQIQLESYEHLPQIIMQFAGQTAPFDVLNMHQLRRHALQFKIPQFQLAARFRQLRHLGSKLSIQVLRALFEIPALTQIARDLREAAQYVIRPVPRKAVMTTEAQNEVPSFLTRQPSSAKRPEDAAISNSRWGQPLSRASLE